MLKINVILHNILLSGVIFEIVMRKFVSKVCCERHDLCLFIII